jgi:hypothetical protein
MPSACKAAPGIRGYPKLRRGPTGLTGYRWCAGSGQSDRLVVIDRRVDDRRIDV